MLQHLGKAQWRAGNGTAAVVNLEAALGFRRAIGAPQDQFESSQLALHHARQRLSADDPTR